MLADVDDVETLLGRTIDGDDLLRVVSLIDFASGIVRGYTRQFLEFVADEEVVISPDAEGELWLPERPVTAVDSLTVNGTAVATSAYAWRGDGHLSRFWPWALPWWTPAPPEVTVVYTHGYDPVPTEVRFIVADLVRNLLSGAAPGVQSESIGSYSISYAGDAAALSDDHRRTLNKYRLRRTSVTVQTWPDRWYSTL